MSFIIWETSGMGFGKGFKDGAKEKEAKQKLEAAKTTAEKADQQFILGNIYLRKGDLWEAKKYLEEAHANEKLILDTYNPTDPAYASAGIDFPIAGTLLKNVITPVIS